MAARSAQAPGSRREVRADDGVICDEVIGLLIAGTVVATVLSEVEVMPSREPDESARLLGTMLVPARGCHVRIQR